MDCFHAAGEGPPSPRPNPNRPIRLEWETFLDRSLFSPSFAEYSALLSEKTILITGAGGSIGSAVALLLMSGLAKRLILLDRSECNLLSLHKKRTELHTILPTVEFIQADILDERHLDEVFSTCMPDVIFHTAALKHVTSLESDPFAALENNVLGTLYLLQMADCFHVQHFVNVSTDKAVNPVSVLGVSKRIAELLLLAMDSAGLCTLSVRLGNILESSGSVVPIFLDSIKNHRPLPITDPLASRYFITLEETATILMEALKIRDASLLLPEMGRPRTVQQLATFIMREVGCDFRDERAAYTGLGDGEKLHEELTYDYEHLLSTRTKQIYRIVGTKIESQDVFADNVGLLLECVVERSKSNLIAKLQCVVPEFRPSATLLRYLS